LGCSTTQALTSYTLDFTIAAGGSSYAPGVGTVTSFCKVKGGRPPLSNRRNPLVLGFASLVVFVACAVASPAMASAGSKSGATAASATTTPPKTVPPKTTPLKPSNTPFITGVTFAGNSRDPIISVYGRDFGGLPAHQPRCHPSTDGQCGNWTGYDFGSQLYFKNMSQVTGFSAGLDDPSLPEQDSVALQVTVFTSTEVVFHFGTWYTKVGVPQLHFLLQRGDRFKVMIKSAAFSGVVEY
jgi:hypothetical protein